MKRLTILLFSVALHAATFYVSSTGNDSNDGSQGRPWLTLQHSVNSVACGDTINVVADGTYVNGDATLPNIAGCATYTTIQSSAISQFAPVGYRTNPANDSALYGKLKFTAQGIIAQAEVHGFSSQVNVYCGISLGTLPTFNVAITCPWGLPNLANGSQVEFESQSEGVGGTSLPTFSVPTPLTILQHYYIVNCSISPACGAQNSTFQLATTPGGTPISITACDANCSAGTDVVEPMQVDTSSSLLSPPDGIGTIANGTPVAFSNAGLQFTGTLPSPLQLDVIYYVVNLSGRSFHVASTPGGSPIALASPGTGMVSMGNTNVPHHWAFRGLELVPSPSAFIYALISFGTDKETSIYGMVNHMEVDRCYFHDNPADNSPVRAIYDNGQYVYIHDNYISGMKASESQAIAGNGSFGPTVIVNNFMEAAGEVTLYGGDWPAYPVSNQNKVFIGNYYYKPPSWKQSASNGAPSGACWYDATDLQHAGGEWYRDIAGNQNYQCGADFLWHKTAAGLPTAYIVKNMAEHKNGRNFQYIGNLFNYSWAVAQAGQAFAFHQAEGSGPAIANDHITVMNNKALNVYSFSTQNSRCQNPAMQPCASFPSNHTFLNNLAVVSAEACGVTFDLNTCGFNLTPHNWDQYPEAGEYWNHNTVVVPDSGLPHLKFAFSASTVGPGCGPFGKLDYWTIKNSIYGYDFNGNCFFSDAVLQNYFTHSNWTNLALVAGAGAYVTPGATNTIANITKLVNNAAMQYASFPPDNVNMGVGDYHLAATSPCSAQNVSATCLSTDGADLGADIDLVNMATSGAAAGTPPWDQQAGLRVNPGSTQVVFRYTSPTADACTATIYRAPARIAGNQVASVADSSANSISDALARELYISGLQPSTQYWYKLACGGGVLLVGNFLTRKPGIVSVQFTFDWSSPTPMQYSSSPSMSSPVSLPAATRQLIPLAANSVVYVQAGIAGPITMLIAP